MRTRWHVRRFAESTSGAAILEFVLILPLVIVLVAGTFEIGRMLFIRLVTERAVVSGARYLARVQDPTCRPACSVGAQHALAIAQEEIVANARIVPGAIRITSQGYAEESVVTMTAQVDVAFDLLSTFGLPVSWTVSASHEERRAVE